MHAVKRESRLDCDGVFDNGSVALAANLAGWCWDHDPTSSHAKYSWLTDW